jgi:hypothetical protein
LSTKRNFFFCQGSSTTKTSNIRLKSFETLSKEFTIKNYNGTNVFSAADIPLFEKITYAQVVSSLFKKITNHQALKKQPNCCAPAEYVNPKQDIEITKLRADTAGGCW